MLQDPAVIAGITRIVERSEKQVDEQKLLASYVDAGIKELLENVNNQIVYGRRGTGKTHLLKVLKESDYFRKMNACVVDIDARNLGSSEQFTDDSLPIGQRCFLLFQDINNIIWQELQQKIYDESGSGDIAAVEVALQDLIRIVTNSFEVYEKRSHKTSRKHKDETQAELGLDASWKSPSVKGSLKDGHSSESQIEEEYAIRQADKIVFPELQQALRKVLELNKTHLLVLIDEWQSLPQDLQPYLAEFLKRSLFPLSQVTVIIAALEYRATFSTHNNKGDFVGFELGADVSANLDIDELYVFDRAKSKIADVYANVLYRHLETEIGNELKEKYLVDDGATLIGKLFSSRETFEELARASEGVIRDLINIFEKAALKARTRGRATIDRLAVTAAARDWFETDKSRSLRQDIRELLDRIIQEVISERKSRTFMLRRDQDKRDTIKRLFDARVLHLVLKGYADKDNPGVKYNIYTIDYGTYVDLLNTTRAPDDFTENLDDEEVIVPFDDKRKIRRIILQPSLLDEFENKGVESINDSDGFSSS